MNKLICLAFLVAVSLSLTHSQGDDPIPEGTYSITFTHPMIPNVNLAKIRVEGNTVFVESECGVDLVE